MQDTSTTESVMKKKHFFHYEQNNSNTLCLKAQPSKMTSLNPQMLVDVPNPCKPNGSSRPISPTIPRPRE